MHKSFGFIAGFTDDRDVLIVTPEGGKIVHTQAYTPEDNYQKIDGEYTLTEDGNIDAKGFYNFWRDTIWR